MAEKLINLNIHQRDRVALLQGLLPGDLTHRTDHGQHRAAPVRQGADASSSPSAWLSPAAPTSSGRAVGTAAACIMRIKS